MIKDGSNNEDSPFLNVMTSAVALTAVAIEYVYVRSFETSTADGVRRLFSTVGNMPSTFERHQTKDGVRL